MTIQNIAKTESKISLEDRYKKNYFWNFRDISTYNPALKRKFIYRSPAPCLIKDDAALVEIFNKYNIKTIVDLRADREIETLHFSENIKRAYNVVHVPFDPWNQNIAFRNTYNSGTNVEIAYHFFALECKDSIKKVVETILSTSDAIIIHCHSGKDRTGIVASLLHLLCGAREEEMLKDYLASKMDTCKEFLQILLSIVDDAGGVVSYLKSCGLSDEQLGNLRRRLRG